MLEISIKCDCIGAGPARKLYEELYCARGDMENRIKEQYSLFAGRVSVATLRAIGDTRAASVKRFFLIRIAAETVRPGGKRR